MSELVDLLRQGSLTAKEITAQLHGATPHHPVNALKAAGLNHFGRLRFRLR